MTEDITGAIGAAALAEANAPVFETIVRMTLDTLERSGLDAESRLLARIAALVTLDAAPASYLLDIGTAQQLGLPIEKIQGTVVAVAPVVGSARAVSAAQNIGVGFGLDLPGTDAARPSAAAITCEGREPCAAGSPTRELLWSWTRSCTARNTR
ncbi:carboxymuconolactone decarboxylase family protein [Streptomyces sp. BK340]|uniref:carboxymuconolactone decarboxylase family protein n=1 Tax=Streptomyces sp. BK340 TaxID=2572903 RepID=UPI0011ACF12A|nr:carboxymuconolactone decarboxylase family protein [Streptomyces sp. BK340]TVZ81838.1 hypothetical protein FB157_126125 [Streptomyces sp. BK340]